MIQTLLSTSRGPPSSENVAGRRRRASTRGRHRTTTERSTSPWCIFSKACSTSSSAMRSVTNLSSVSRPCRCEVDQHREVAARQAVAVPGRLQRPAAAEERAGSGSSSFMSGAGTPTSTDGPARSRASKACLHVSGLPTASMTTSAPNPSVSSRMRLDRVVVLGVDAVGGAEALGPLELPVVDVDGDDRRGAGQRGARDRRVAHAAAADDRDGVAALHLTGVDRGARAGHDPAADQARPPPDRCPG